MHDDMQAFRILEMDHCFRDKQLPCRWVPDAGFGYGYPLFNYYPPFPFYLGELVHLLGFSILDSVKIVFILGFIVAAGSMFLLGEALWGTWGGFLSSVFYTFAPYHALDIYVRGALNEFWALAWFPAILWTIFKFVKTQDRRYLLWFSFFYGLLFLSHNLMVFIFTPVAIFWLFLNLFLEKKVKIWPKFIWPSLLAVGLAAFFLLPVLFEKKFVHVETMIIGYFNYLAHFVSLKQLFFSRSWGYGASVWKEDEKISFQIGVLHWIIAFLVSLLSAFGRKKEKKRLFRIFFIFFFGLGAAFFAHSRSTFFWKKIKPLEYLQFPWRFLTLVTFSFSLLVGGLVPLFDQFLKKKKVIIKLAVLGLVVLVIFFNVDYFQPEEWYWNLTDEQKFSEPVEWQEQVTSGIFDYLPKSAEFPPGEAAPEQAWLEEGEGEVRAYQKGSNWLKFNLEVFSDRAKVKVPIFYFPKWSILVDGQKIDFDYQNKLGLPTFDLSKGSYQVEARLKNTPIRTISNWLSLFFWLVFLRLVLKNRRARKKKT
jgi:hypothetical protein